MIARTAATAISGEKSNHKASSSGNGSCSILTDKVTERTAAAAAAVAKATAEHTAVTDRTAAAAAASVKAAVAAKVGSVSIMHQQQPGQCDKLQA